MRFRALLLLSLVACASSEAPAKAPLTTTAAPAAKASPAVQPIALTHVTIIDVATGNAMAERTLVLDGDRIAKIGDAPKDAKVYDMHGKFVIPGLWDMHVHFTEPGYGRMFVANGVTGVRVMWGNPKTGNDSVDHDGMRKAFDEKKLVGPRMKIASNIMDGPRPVWPGSLALHTPDEGRKAVDDAKKSGADFIKVYSMLPRDVFFAIAEESKKDGIPFEGHVPESVSVIEASDAGQKSIEHLTGMLLATSGKEDALRKAAWEFSKAQHSGPEWMAFLRKNKSDAIASYDPKHANDLFAKLVANGTAACPTFTVNSALANINDPAITKDPRLSYVSASTREEWNPKNDFRLKNRTKEDFDDLRHEVEQDVRITHDAFKAGVSILAGTDQENPYCFAGFSLHDELAWMVKAGLTPTEALRTATVNPAKFFGMTDAMGAVEEGKVADLVVLDADPRADIANTKRIAMVVSRGVAYDRATLDGMLEAQRADAAKAK